MFIRKIIHFFQRAFAPTLAMLMLAGLFAPVQARQETPSLFHRQPDTMISKADLQDIQFHLEVFALNHDGRTVWHRWNINNDWSSWEPLEKLPAKAVSPPRAVSWGVGRVDVFILCGTNPTQLYHNWYDRDAGRGWGAWENWGKPGVISLKNDISAISRVPGTLDVFAIGENNQIYRIRHYYGEQHGWISFWTEENVAEIWNLSAVWGPGDELDLFFNKTLRELGDDVYLYPYLYRRHWVEGTNSWYADDEKYMAWNPDAVFVDYGLTEIALFATRLPYRKIDQFSFGPNGNMYPGKQPWDGTIFLSQAAVSPQRGRIDVFALGEDDQLYTRTMMNNQFQGDWQEFSAPGAWNRFIGAPDAISWTAPRPSSSLP